MGFNRTFVDLWVFIADGMLQWSSNQTRNIDGQPCQVGNYYQHLRILGSYGLLVEPTTFSQTQSSREFGDTFPWTLSVYVLICLPRGEEKNLLTQSLTVVSYVSFHKKERPHWLFQPVPATLEINILTWLSGLFFAMKNLAFSCQKK